MPKEIIRHIPCVVCDTVIGQSQYDITKGRNKCWRCKDKVFFEKRKNGEIIKAKNHLEIVLPVKREPFLCPKRNEWCMKVRVRKRNSGEKFKLDRMWMGLSGDVSPEAAMKEYKIRVARMMLDGTLEKESKEKKAVRRRYRAYARKQANVNKWKTGKERQYGIKKVVVKLSRYRIELPDPTHPHKTIRYDRYKTKMEARMARKVPYQELSKRILPCAICGKLPVLTGRNGHGPLQHADPDCPNIVRFPNGLLPLFKVKLWNIVFSTGEVKNARKVTKEQLRDMGFMGTKGQGTKLHVRRDVEFDFRRAALHAVPPVGDEDAMFE